jgi:hypothetical protein
MTRKRKKDHAPPTLKPWEIDLGGGEVGIRVDIFFELLEREIGLLIVACDVECDQVVHGGDLLDELGEEEQEGSPMRQLEPIPQLTDDQRAKLDAAEEELGYRLVAFHRGANAIVYGASLFDEAVAKFGSE